MKKYKLLKDLPDIDAGVEFVLDKDILYSPVAWEEVQKQYEAKVAIVWLYPGHGRYKVDFFKDFDDWFEEVKPERFSPKQGEKYFCVVSAGNDSVQRWVWHGDSSDRFLYSTGNCFRTREQAEEAARRVKETLMRYQGELMES